MEGEMPLRQLKKVATMRSNLRTEQKLGKYFCRVFSASFLIFRALIKCAFIGLVYA